MKNTNYFYCYTSDLKDFLKSKGLNYITTAKALSNDKQFWLFKRSDKLMRYFYEYKTINSN